MTAAVIPLPGSPNVPVANLAEKAEVIEEKADKVEEKGNDKSQSLTDSTDDVGEVGQCDNNVVAIEESAIVVEKKVDAVNETAISVENTDPVEKLADTIEEPEVDIAVEVEIEDISTDLANHVTPTDTICSMHLSSSVATTPVSPRSPVSPVTAASFPTLVVCPEVDPADQLLQNSQFMDTLRTMIQEVIREELMKCPHASGNVVREVIKEELQQCPHDNGNVIKEVVREELSKFSHPNVSEIKDAIREELLKCPSVNTSLAKSTIREESSDCPQASDIPIPTAAPITNPPGDKHVPTQSTTPESRPVVSRFRYEVDEQFQAVADGTLTVDTLALMISRASPTMGMSTAVEKLLSTCGKGNSGLQQVGRFVEEHGDEYSPPPPHVLRGMKNTAQATRYTDLDKQFMFLLKQWGLVAWLYELSLVSASARKVEEREFRACVLLAYLEAVGYQAKGVVAAVQFAPLGEVLSKVQRYVDNA